MSYYPIQLDKARNFKYGMRALDRIEKKLKTKIALLDMGSLSMDETATLIWAGLVHEDSKLTVENVMDLIDDYSTLPEVTAIMNEAFETTFGTKETTEEVTEEEKN
jgi:hypothetical protein